MNKKMFALLGVVCFLLIGLTGCIEKKEVGDPCEGLIDPADCPGDTRIYDVNRDGIVDTKDVAFCYAYIHRDEWPLKVKPYYVIEYEHNGPKVKKIPVYFIAEAVVYPVNPDYGEYLFDVNFDGKVDYEDAGLIWEHRDEN